MLGSIVHFERGAVISVLMLVPAVLGVVMLTILERFNFQYKQVGQSELVKHRLRDALFTIYSILCVTAVCIIFQPCLSCLYQRLSVRFQLYIRACSKCTRRERFNKGLHQFSHRSGSNSNIRCGHNIYVGAS